MEDTVIAEALKWYPKEIAKYNVGRHTMKLINGSEIRFRHCSSVKDMNDYSGAEIQWLYIDELTSFEKAIFDFLLTRLRAKRGLNITPVVRCASNPGNIGHSWVKQYFVDAGPYGEMVHQKVWSNALKKEKDFTTQYIPALAMDNPYIGDDYLYELERKPEALRRALLNGDWDAFEGQVFTEWVDLVNKMGKTEEDIKNISERKWTHVIKPFNVPLNWPRYMGFDHGYSSPFSVQWWAIGPKGEAYLYREWYGAKSANVGIKLTPREIAEGIIEREQEEADNNIVIDRVAGHDTFERSRGDSIAQQMEPKTDQYGNTVKKGVYFRKGDNSRIAGKMQYHERLRFGEDGKPFLYVFDTCRDFIRTIPNLPYDPKHPEDVDTDAEDHCLVGGTWVSTETGTKRIKDLVGKTGRVFSHDGYLHGFSDCRMTQANVDVFTVETDWGDVTATKNHRFMLKDGAWKRLDELQIGDLLWNGVEVTGFSDSGKADVYNMEVEDTHSFYANGLVVHNCYDAGRFVLMARTMPARTAEIINPKPYDPFTKRR